MQIKIPYINTRIEADILLTLLLMPFWWVSGFSILAYHLTSILVFTKLLMRGIRFDEPLNIPNIVWWFILFLAFYLFSIVLNAPMRPAQRVLASLNNYSMLVMGMLLMVAIYNSEPSFFFKRLFKTCRILCIITGMVGLIFLALWYHGSKNLKTLSWLGHMVPSLTNYPYFYMLLVITTTLSDWFSRSEMPRLSIYCTVPTATGGLMLFFIPLTMAYYALKRKSKIEFWMVILVALTVMFFTISRAAMYGFVGAVVFVSVIERGKRMIFAFSAMVLTLVSTGYLQKWVDWILKIRESSTIGRMSLYREALRVVMEENPLFGVGIRMREGFTFMAIGSHALYIEIIFVAGLVGLGSFLWFQFLVMKNWYDQKAYLRSRTDKIFWKYLGMSLIAMNIWAVTDTLLALPFIPYAYFVITGGILALDAELKRKALSPVA